MQKHHIHLNNYFCVILALKDNNTLFSQIIAQSNVVAVVLL